VPEGDTVRRAATRLHAALAGSELTHAELNVTRHATADLVGARVLEVVPRGKHLLTRVERAGGPEDERLLTVHTHLRMDGTWRLVRAPASPYVVPRHEIRALLQTEQWSAVGHLLGMVDLVRTADEHTVVGHLGPDLLDPELDRDEALRRLSADPQVAIGDALRDQRLVAGLGNELVNETLFLRGLDPWAPVGEVDLEPTLDLATRLIRANATRDVRSSTGDLRPGRTSYVFGRAGRACRRCGTRIRMEHQGTGPTARAAWWCPSCQPRRSREQN
jgi:endonuclease-8